MNTNPDAEVPSSDLPWAMRFGAAMEHAEVYAALDWPGDWKREIARILESEQRQDGSFANTATYPMTEDDPLLATTLAVVAPSRCRE